MINLNNNLKIDIFGWTLFGLLWVFIPKKLLSINFVNTEYDWITVHMTQAFGLLCIFSAVPSYISLKYNLNDEQKINTIKMKLIFELILLFLMITANKKILPSHARFGMLGLSLCILINIFTLYIKK